MGPVLAWHRDSVVGQVLRCLVAVTTVVAGVVLISLVNGDGPWELLRHWQIWLIVLVGSYLMSSPLEVSTVSVGSDWFQTSHGRRWYRRARTNYLKLYELIEVTGSADGGAPELYLSDGERAMRRRIDELQPDRRTWDLIYNGILHSVAAGAEIDVVSAALLHLHMAPAVATQLRESCTETARVVRSVNPSPTPHHS
jgi:hypothetical protein